MKKITQTIAIIALAGLGAGFGYWLYKNRFPTFEVLELNEQTKTIQFRYGSKIYTTNSLQNETFYEDITDNYALNISPIEENEQVVGLNFHFVGNDTRKPQYLYF